MGPSVEAFDPKSTLLRSDVMVEGGFAKFWARSPKICSPTGDILEILPVPDLSLDPVRAVMYYIEFRDGVHNESADRPIFLEEDGRMFTK